MLVFGRRTSVEQHRTLIDGRAGVLIFSMKSLSSTGDKVCDRATAGTWVLLLL